MDEYTWKIIHEEDNFRCAIENNNNNIYSQYILLWKVQKIIRGSENINN